MNPDRDRDVAVADETKTHGARPHDESLLDQALAETFPASDPIAPAVEARSPTARDQDAAMSGKTGGAARWRGRVKRVAPAAMALGALVVALRAVRRMRGGQNAHKARG
jgi:hypothetical protein